MEMNPLKCDLCGSTDIIKDGEYFVCQHCGTKYSVETAKQMMFSGTVTVDNNNQVNNYIKLAQNEFGSVDEPDLDSNDFYKRGQKGVEYLEKAVQLDPNNLEIEKLMAEANMFGFTDYSPKAGVATFRKTIEKMEEGERKQFIQMVFDRYIKIFNGRRWVNVWRPRDVVEYGAPLWTEMGIDENQIDMLVDQNVRPTYESYLSKYNTGFEFDNTVVNSGRSERERTSIINDFKFVINNARSKDLKKNACELLIKYLKIYPRNYIYESGNKKSTGLQQENLQLIQEAEKIINEIDPSSIKAEGKKSGCYVATAVYGSYDCPEVWTLRRFRDYDLAETWYGRAFIRTYYAASPTIVKWFGKTHWFNSMWKPVLDKMVLSLKFKGYDDTPYNDKQW